LNQETRDGVNQVRVALANIRLPANRELSVVLAVEAIQEAAAADAQIICFPECFIPGYRMAGSQIPPPDTAFLERAWSAVARAAEQAQLTVILGTERIVYNGLRATALVVHSDGTVAGFQDKVQLDPSEEGTYVHGETRCVFHTGQVTFGVVICHEAWRYPETVRWAVRCGAKIVFHSHFHPPEPGANVPATFADPANSFHEKALLCRAAENTCYIASTNCAMEGSPTTSVFVRPDGTVLKYQPYGKDGLLIADLDLTLATGLLASRLRTFLAE